LPAYTDLSTIFLRGTNMPAPKPQPNYLPFFGPFNREWNAIDDQTQFLTWPLKQKKSESLLRLLQMGPMSPPSGTSEGLSGDFVQTAAKNSRPLAPSKDKRQEPAPSGSKGFVKKAWEVANTPIADLAGGEGTTRKFLVGDVDRMMAAAQRELDQRAARGEEITYWDALKSVGGLGMGKDAADFVASFTSPVGLATSFLGLLGKGAKAAKPALRATQQLLGTLMGAPAAYGLATGQPLETLKSTAKVLTGGQSDVSPDRARQDLANASGVAGAFGSGLSRFDFARGRLQNIPGELPAKQQRISYSNHDNSLISMEEAVRRSNSPEFRKHAVEGGEKIARDYQNEVHGRRTSVSKYEGKAESSVATDVSGKRKSTDAAAAAIGKEFDQKSVLRFRKGFTGRQPEYTLKGVEDPVAALDVLKKHGVEGARVENGNLVFVDLGSDLGPKVRSAASELGATLSKTRGRGKLIEAKDYDRILREYEDQQNVINKGSAVNPLYFSGIGTSYAAQPKGNSTNSHRKRR
jgi:hypothetical protein